MKKQLTLLTLGLLATSAMAQSESASTRKSVEAFVARMDKAAMSGNLNLYMSMLTPDYVFVNENGDRMTKGQMRAGIVSMMRVAKNYKVKTMVKNVQRQNMEAAVWLESTMSWSQRSGNRWVTMKETMRSAATLVPNGNSWLIKYEQQLPTNEPWDFKTGGGGQH